MTRRPAVATMAACMILGVSSFFLAHAIALLVHIRARSMTQRWLRMLCGFFHGFTLLRADATLSSGQETPCFATSIAVLFLV